MTITCKKCGAFESVTTSPCGITVGGGRGCTCHQFIGIDDNIGYVMLPGDNPGDDELWKNWTKEKINGMKVSADTEAGYMTINVTGRAMERDEVIEENIALRKELEAYKQPAGDVVEAVDFLKKMKNPITGWAIEILIRAATERVEVVTVDHLAGDMVNALYDYRLCEKIFGDSAAKIIIYRLLKKYPHGLKITDGEKQMTTDKTASAELPDEIYLSERCGIVLLHEREVMPELKATKYIRADRTTVPVPVQAGDVWETVELEPTIGIAREIQLGAKAWEPKARIIGNVPAGDIFTCIETLIRAATERVEVITVDEFVNELDAHFAPWCKEPESMQGFLRRFSRPFKITDGGEG